MDVSLYYTEEGAGSPLILLHGNGGDGSYFKNQIEHFAGRYRVIALDTRGHGRSPRGEAPFTIRQFAEDLRAFMDEKHIEKADILGFSDGGNIALCFALKYPERVDRLILNGANLDPSGVKRSFQLPVELGYRFASRFAGKSPKARKNTEMMALMVNDPMIPEESLRSLQVETLVIAGTNDIIKQEHSEKIAALLPRARLFFIKGDHFIAAKAPEAFNRAVDEFLTR